MRFAITARFVVFAAVCPPGFFSSALNDVLFFVISAH
jgi:hypothetical protein